MSDGVLILMLLNRLNVNFMLIEGANPALPDPVYLALQLIKIEQLMHEKADEAKALEEKVSEQSAEMEKSKKEREFEVTKLKKDVKVMQEKLDRKAKDADEKGRKDDKYNYHGKNGGSKLTDELKEELKKLKDEREKVSKIICPISTRIRSLLLPSFHVIPC